MEQAKEGTLDVNCPTRKLNFNLPLLSTRRVGGPAGEKTYCTTIPHVASQNTSDRIPFCWEQAAGKPKEDIERIDIHEGETPRPRLPPCRWYQEKQQEEANKNSCVNVREPDDGFDGDVDEDVENEDDVFSDAVDMLSLTEAIDIAQKAEDEQRTERGNLGSVGKFSDDQLSPNFMIERFLPDAAALAASSVLYASKNLSSNKVSYSWNCSENYGSPIVGRSCSPESTSHWGCGLEILFPWRMKHKLCGVKSPVRQVPPHLQSPKKNRHFSTDTPFSDVYYKDT